MKTFKEFVNEQSEERVDEVVLKNMTPKKVSQTSTRDLSDHTKKITGKPHLSPTADFIPNKMDKKRGKYINGDKELMVRIRDGLWYLTGEDYR